MKVADSHIQDFPPSRTQLKIRDAAQDNSNKACVSATSETVGLSLKLAPKAPCPMRECTPKVDPGVMRV